MENAKRLLELSAARLEKNGHTEAKVNAANNVLDELLELDGHAGWKVERDAEDGTVEIRFTLGRHLPCSVRYARDRETHLHRWHVDTPGMNHDPVDLLYNPATERFEDVTNGRPAVEVLVDVLVRGLEAHAARRRGA